MYYVLLPFLLGRTQYVESVVTQLPTRELCQQSVMVMALISHSMTLLFILSS
jgi:hypothetical protein